MGGKAKMKPASAFKDWFRAQFGKVPLLPIQRLSLEEEAERLRYRLAMIEVDLKTDDIMQARWTSALYAWQMPKPPEREEGT